MKKYTYNDWWKGIICPADDNAPEGLIKWKDIVAEDVIKIKEKQKEIFESEAKSIFTDWKELFIEQRQNSKEPDFLKKNTLNEIKQILFGELPNVDIIVTNYLEFRIPQTEYKRLRKYIKEIYEYGKVMTYDFVYSPYYALKHLNYPIIDGEAMYRFYKWLINFSNESNEVFNNDENPFPDIFKDNDSYKLYTELKEKLIKNSGLNAGHSFIYHTLKFNDHIKDIKHQVYIDFLKNHEELTIKANKIISRKPDYLKKILKKNFSTLKQY
jgi:hypothetical protein